MSRGTLPAEIDHFNALAQNAWDEQGPLWTLHRMNPVRLRYILDHIQTTLNKPVKGLNITDIGCGVGILAEPLARLGAKVTGIDAAPENISVAKEHAKLSGLKVNYLLADIWGDETFLMPQDVILMMELLEHVPDPAAYIAKAASYLKTGGLMILSTMNRTFLSKLGAITLAEDILKIVPQGTHHHEQFIKPDELEDFMTKAGLEVIDQIGMQFYPHRKEWGLSRRQEINYIMVGIKGSVS